MKILVIPIVLAALSLFACRSTGPAADTTLPTGIDWVLASITTGGTITAILADAPPTLRFDAAESEINISGFAGVNRYMGTCTSSGGSGISLSPLAMTMMAGPPEAMELEQRFTTLLQQASSFAVEGDQMTIQTPAGSLEFRAE